MIDAYANGSIKLPIDKYIAKEVDIRNHFKQYTIYRFPEIIGEFFSTKFYDCIKAKDEIDTMYKENNIEYPFIHEDDVSSILRSSLIRTEGVISVRPYNFFSLDDLLPNNRIIYSDPLTKRVRYKY